MRRFLLALCLAACGGVALPLATPTDAQRGGVSADELNRGRALYASRCSVCHSPYAPTRFPAADWPRLVGEMRERAKLRDEDRAAIERYLVTMASR